MGGGEEAGRAMDKGNAALIFCVFLVFPISTETFYVLWSALLCAHFTG